MVNKVASLSCKKKKKDISKKGNQWQFLINQYVQDPIEPLEKEFECLQIKTITVICTMNTFSAVFIHK